MLKDIAKKLAQYYFFKDIERIVFMAFGAVEVMRFFVCEGAILAGAFFGALSGALIGGISGGIAGIRNGGSFLEGFADGALGGSLSGAITGAILPPWGLQALLWELFWVVPVGQWGMRLRF